ncbi:MAG: RNA polymerase subunit sigma-70 [Ramlibacter sp.]|nr:RNA polymerase subunit sigma-70 [Ramlibacter sp.]
MGRPRTLRVHRRRGSPSCDGPRRAVSLPSPAGPRAEVASAAVAQAAERAARESYGRLVAILSARTRDIAMAEDALAEAFACALESWPQEGVPANPSAWLLTVARRRTLDEWRHSQVVADAAQTLLATADELIWDDASGAVPDERLRLLFVCAHPAVQAAARAPLMLQAVLGLDVSRMAGAFLLAPATLGQRLVRAKARIREAGIPFEHPQARDLPQRLQDVLDGIYAAYGTGWDDVEGADAARRGLTTEAIELGRILCARMPNEPEPAGLLALMLFCESRAEARRSPAGAYVPLDQQDTARWNHAQREEAEALLLAAARRGAPGPFQLEAAIQSAHTQRRLGAAVPPQALVVLYDGLLALRPSLGAQVSRACAVAAASGPAAALKVMDALPADDVAHYQPYWAARAHLLAQAGQADAARQADAQAMGLTENAAVRAWLAGRF